MYVRYVYVYVYVRYVYVYVYVRYVYVYVYVRYVYELITSVLLVNSESLEGYLHIPDCP